MIFKRRTPQPSENGTMMAQVLAAVRTQSSGDWATAPASAFERHLFTGFFGRMREELDKVNGRGGWRSGVVR